jgi:hypothetical protein
MGESLGEWRTKEQEYEDKIGEPVNETTTLYRPVGQNELDLILASGYREFPPRAPHQPIFTPSSTKNTPRKSRAIGTPKADRGEVS